MRRSSYELLIPLIVPQCSIKPEDPVDQVYKNKLIFKIPIINYCSSHCVKTSLAYFRIHLECLFSHFKCIISVVYNVIIGEYIHFCTTPYSVIQLEPLC